jgi:cytoskeletal protein CcmA (bactofilin family)
VNFFKQGSSPPATHPRPNPEARPMPTPKSAAADAFAPLVTASRLLEPTLEPMPKAEAPPAAKPAAKPADVRPSLLGPTFRFKGELKADEDLLIQGRCEGSIHHTKTLTIGTDGIVKGDTRARVLIIDGTVDGDLYALESITVRATAKVNGNLHSPRIALADGATFNGRIDMTSAARAARAIVERQAAATIDDSAVESLLRSP